ncbi:MAG: glycosyltransferase family 2 protein [Calditrichaeota bacterium]|nr:glycosyltransferase family 2 protein [Calditrichota bacterium]
MSAADQPAVGAVVVAHNSIRDIGECLTSLEAQSHPIRTIVVVDNGSMDGTADLVERDYQSILLIRTTNIGFAAGNNLGIRHLSADWILTLNPDAKLAPDWIRHLLDFAADHPRAGALGGVLLRWDDAGDEVVDSTGIEIFASRRVRDRHFGALRSGLPNEPGRVFGICAAAALYRRETLEETAVPDGIFPERFFSYYEDADLAWRIWRHNREAWFVPTAVGWHRRGGSSSSSHFSRYLTHRNRYYLIARNDRWRDIFPHIGPILLHELVMLLRMIRHPLLIKAVVEVLASAKILTRERREFLPEVSPPFQRGIGFSATSWQSAILARQKNHRLR